MVLLLCVAFPCAGAPAAQGLPPAQQAPARPAAPRAASHGVAAARYTYQSARDLVVLVTANMYLETLASSARADSARAQLQTAQALFTQATDLRQSGIVAGIDVLRAQLQLSTQ